MKCENCGSEKTQRSDDSKRMICLACGISTVLEDDEQHAGGGLGRELVSKVDRLQKSVDDLTLKVEPPPDPAKEFVPEVPTGEQSDPDPDPPEGDDADPDPPAVAVPAAADPYFEGK